LNTLRTGQRFLEGFECLRGGHIRLADVLPGYAAAAICHDHVRTVAAAVLMLGHAPERNASFTPAVVCSSRRQPGLQTESATSLTAPFCSTQHVVNSAPEQLADT
jgi:hypothetical protein